MERIDERLAIASDDIAAILGVPRRTLYAWRKGEEPETQPGLEVFAKLQQLAEVAQTWSTLSPSPVANLLRWPVGEMTLFELLAQPMWDKEALDTVLRDLALVRERQMADALCDAAKRVPRSELTEGERRAEHIRLQATIRGM